MGRRGEDHVSEAQGILGHERPAKLFSRAMTSPRRWRSAKLNWRKRAASRRRLPRFCASSVAPRPTPGRYSKRSSRPASGCSDRMRSASIQSAMTTWCGLRRGADRGRGSPARRHPPRRQRDRPASSGNAELHHIPDLRAESDLVARSSASGMEAAGEAQSLLYRADAAGRSRARLDPRRPLAAEAVLRPGAGAVAELRRSGGDRDRERAAVPRDAGGARAADGVGGRSRASSASSVSDAAAGVRDHPATRCQPATRIGFATGGARFDRR